jgi:hypothetical protein
MTWPTARLGRFRTTAEDIVGPARKAEEMFHATCLTPTTGVAIRKLADLSPKTLALMHGSSFNGDTVRALNDLADLYDGWFREASHRDYFSPGSVSSPYLSPG